MLPDQTLTLLPHEVTLSLSMTPDQFEQFVMQPENVDQNYELIGAKVYEMVSNGPSSVLGAKFLYFVLGFVMEHNLGVVTGADGGYRVGGDRCIPDVAFTKAERATGEMIKGYYIYAPDLGIEIISPTDKPKKIRQKITSYINAGVTVWLVDPEDKTLEIHAPQQAVQELGMNDVLDGGNLLPNFTLELKRVFA